MCYSINYDYLGSVKPGFNRTIQDLKVVHSTIVSAWRIERGYPSLTLACSLTEHSLSPQLWRHLATVREIKPAVLEKTRITGTNTKNYAKNPPYREFILAGKGQVGEVGASTPPPPCLVPRLIRLPWTLNQMISVSGCRESENGPVNLDMSN